MKRRISFILHCSMGKKIVFIPSLAQFGSAPALGAGGRRFKSYNSDHITSSIKKIFKMMKKVLDTGVLF